MTSSPDKSSLWLQGGQPVRISWLGNENTFDVATADWQPLAELREGGNRLEIGIVDEGPADGTWVRTSGLIAGAAAGARGNIGWHVAGDGDIDVPGSIASFWSDAWLAWRHGEIDDQGLFDRLIPPATRDTGNSVCFPRRAVQGPGLLSGWRAPLLLTAVAAVGFSLGWALSSRAKEQQAAIPPAPATRTTPDAPDAPDASQKETLPD